MRWYKTMRTNPAGALELEGRIQSFLRGHILPLVARYGFSNCALDKLLAAIGGWGTVGTRLRWPYRWAQQSEVTRLREIARRELPEMFSV